MGLGQKLRSLFGWSPPRAESPGRPWQRIDAAETTDENRRHWAQADGFSADAAYDPAVRYKLRNRSRYEAVNNCYAKGVVRSAGDEVIGTGPRLRLTIPTDKDGTIANKIERSWRKWADRSKLAINLHVAEKSRVRDGGCFAVFDTNERLDHPVKFDLRWLEAEMCTTPFEMQKNTNVTDGIEFDRFGNPIRFFFLTYHPGSTLLPNVAPLQYYPVPAEYVIHWYTMDRFGQHREIPELTPALPLYSQVRRYTLATLTAAEFASMIAGVMKTKGVPNFGEENTTDIKVMEMVRGALLTLPEGWDASQFNPTQPTTNYPDFKREILNESGRATGHPLNGVTGNSSGYNYSSGRLDGLPRQRNIRILRNDLRLLGMDRIFDAWCFEAQLVGEIPGEAGSMDDWDWSWGWDGFDSIDPNKDAMTDDLRLANKTATYAEVYAEYGQDWREELAQIAKEKAYCESLGIPWGAPIGTAAPIEPKTRAVAMAMSEFGISESVVSATIDLLRADGVFK